MFYLSICKLSNRVFPILRGTNQISASRAGAEVLFYAGDASLHPRSRSTHLGRFPTVCLT